MLPDTPYIISSLQHVSQLRSDCRPTLLLDEFEAIPAALKVLHATFDPAAVDHMVQEQPLFLVEDVQGAVSSLNRSARSSCLKSFPNALHEGCCYIL